MSLFDLAAKITLDSSSYERGLDDAESKGKSFGAKLGKTLGTGLKAVAGATAAAAGAVGKVLSDSISAYADYEQLVGGVETLFGESAGKVLADSQAAFRSAGMSMNDYMETSIQSAAALINSLGGDQAKAAELMNVSIVDMADNVNKMGTSMEGVQNAYRGFSRGNFTMLDNLALGFAGTKEGMQELLDKAHELSGVEYDISSYSDIVKAIHVVQTEMGITGTTAQEAASTIQGSLGSVKAAWANLVTGISDSNADITALISDLTSSASALLGNLIPIAKQALLGIGEAVKSLTPTLTEALPRLIHDVVPPLLTAAINLVESLGGALLDNADILINDALELITSAVQHLSDAKVLTRVVNAAVQIVATLGKGLSENASKLLSAALSLITELAMALVEPNNLSELIDTAIELVIALADGLVDSAGELLKVAPKIIGAILKGITDNLQPLLNGAIDLIIAIGKGLIEYSGEIVPYITEMFGVWVKFFGEAFATLAEWVGKIFANVGEWINENVWQPVAAWLSGLWDKLLEWLDPIIAWMQEEWEKITAPIVKVWKAVMEVLKPLLDALKELFSATWELVKQVVADAVDAAKAKIETAWNAIWTWLEPILTAIGATFNSIWTAIKEVVTTTVQAVWDKIATVWSKIESALSTPVENAKNTISAALTWIHDKITGLVDGAYTWGTDLLSNFAAGIKNAFSAVTTAVTNVTSWIKGMLHHSTPDFGPLKDDDEWMPDMMRGFAKGIRDNADLVKSAFDETFDLEPIPLTATFSGGDRRRADGAGTVININVDGANYSDADDLALRIAEELEHVLDRREAAYA